MFSVYTLLKQPSSLLLLIFCVACNTEPNIKENPSPPVRVIKKKSPSDSVKINLTVVNRIPINDSLDELAGIIAGSMEKSSIYPSITSSSFYKNYRAQFSKRWNNFDSLRINKLKNFHDSDLVKNVQPGRVVFYPFSGPDFLYAGLFFPEAEKYLMVGLEPVGTLNALEKANPDSLQNYFSSLNRSLDAILKFSFFRTNSMEEDLNSKDLDGVMHLLFLFLKREGNRIVSARPIGVDSSGQKYYHATFNELKDKKHTIRGIEIKFLTSNDSLKELDYFSLNLSDPGIRKNSGFQNYLLSLPSYITYLKGASYLLHKPYFSRIRYCILSQSTVVVQDDSGIALHYFLADKRKWTYRLYGEYSEPISLFRKAFQPSLDSLYRKIKPVPLGFGIGYNFKDNNSNLMIATPR